MARHIVFSDEQYEAIIDALALAHPNQKVNKHKTGLMKSLPDPIFKDLSLIRDVIDQPKLLLSATSGSILVRQLIVLDSSKKASRVSTKNIVNLLTQLFEKDLVLGKNARDLVFDENPAFKFPGKLIKNHFAEALTDCDLASHNMFTEYKSRVLGQYPGGDTMRIFTKIIESKSAYAKDVNLLTRLGSSNNRGVAILAVSVADKKILPYMVGISNKFAKRLLEERLRE